MTAIAIDNVAAFGAEELDTETAEMIEGGFPWAAALAGVAGGLLGDALYDIYNDTASARAAFMRGFNSV